MLRDLGIQLLVMPLEHYHELDGSLPPAFTDPSMLYTTFVADDVAMGVAVIDPVSSLLDPQRSDGRTTAETAVAVFAELTATRLQLHDATRVAILSAPKFTVPDADVLGMLEQIVAEHPDFHFERLSFVATATDTFRLDGEPVAVALPDIAGPDIADRSLRLSATRLELAKVASMLPDDDPRPGDWHGDLDRWLSTAFENADIDERIDDLLEALDRIPASIVQPEPFTFTLTGDASDISIRITNAGDTPLTVVLTAEASKLTFPDGDREITLHPGVNTVTVPVRTRSNGTFPVTFELLTPVGRELVGEPLVLTARVNALTGLGQVLTGGAVIVLASWWFSHLRTRRRRRLSEAEERARRTHPASNGVRSDTVSTP